MELLPDSSIRSQLSVLLRVLCGVTERVKGLHLWSWPTAPSSLHERVVTLGSRGQFEACLRVARLPLGMGEYGVLTRFHKFSPLPKDIHLSSSS